MVDANRTHGANGLPTGYYIPGGGSNNATFETLFLRLQPKVIVNDNVVIKTEFWAGSPTFGLFGNCLSVHHRSAAVLFDSVARFVFYGPALLG